MGFKRFDPEDFVVSANTVTSTVWSNNAVSLNTFFTSSVQTEGSSGPYYLNIYQTASTDNSAEVQFSIAYANSEGGGGADFDASVVGISPTTTIYGQYRTLVLEDENSLFTFGPTFTGAPDNDFYVISIERARYKEKLFPGSFNLILSSSNTVATGFPALHLTDDSREVILPTFYGTQRAYQIISGSDGLPWRGNGYSRSGSYGLFLPDISTILLNAKALDDNLSPGSTGVNDGCGINLGTVRTQNSFSNNPRKLFNHISGSSGNIFELNSQETITSDFIFVRTRNSEFNYSENPSFISGSTGEVIYSYFIDNPQTFATTVGMYNDSNELLAVAKLSKPLTKDFTKEALIRVKLDF
jgi:hypothetical protein